MSDTRATGVAAAVPAPVGRAAVFWVGHSLVEQKARTPAGEIDLMTLVGELAVSAGLGYTHGSHALWGSSLAVLWRGSGHYIGRRDASLVPRREAFERNAGAFDTLVLTEILPVAMGIEREFAAYYARRFYCAIKLARPEARVLLYQTWTNLQTPPGGVKARPDAAYDWRAEMVRQRPLWARLAEAAVAPSVAAPGLFSRFGFHARSDGGCTARDPIHIVPVGAAMVAVADAIARGGAGVGSLVHPDGRPLAVADFFANPYVEGRPPGAAPASTTATPPAPSTLRDPSRPHDDIHSSALGIYLTALVHFAAIYRRPPVELAHPAFVGDRLGRALGCIAWNAVLDEPRSGVAGSARC